MKANKIYIANFWRGNPQLKDGGYYTNRTIEAPNKREAMKIVKRHEKCIYGTMTFLGWANEGK